MTLITYSPCLPEHPGLFSGGFAATSLGSVPMDAVIFVPLDCDIRRWSLACWTYCMRHHLRPIAVAHSWDDVRRMILSGEAKKVVVATREHVGDWLEIVSEEREPRGPTPTSQQRTGRM